MKELGLKAVIYKKRPAYRPSEAHEIFPDLLQQDFSAQNRNQKWCTDFTYLFLKNGEVRYNCTILDLYDRSVISSITDRSITSDLAIRTLEKALAQQKPSLTHPIILHSDQGKQFTSKEFIRFCNAHNVIQSMSRAGCPYDNAVMERYYNTLKNECTDLQDFSSEEELYNTVERFSYTFYNYSRPHSYNGYQPPLIRS